MNMTPKEAIGVLESISAKTDYILITDDARSEALDMAISALQTQDLQPTCNQLATDAISITAAIDAIVNCTNCGDEKTLRAYVQKHNLDNEWIGGILEALNAIKDLPSAQPDIIRCRECKNCQIDSVFHDYWCDGRKVWKDHYCGYAERRTDGEVD